MSYASKWKDRDEHMVTSKKPATPLVEPTNVDCPYDDCDGKIVFQGDSGQWFYCLECDFELPYPRKTDEDKELFMLLYAGLHDYRSKHKTWPSDKGKR